MSKWNIRKEQRNTKLNETIRRNSIFSKFEQSESERNTYIEIEREREVYANEEGLLGIKER